MEITYEQTYVTRWQDFRSLILFSTYHIIYYLKIRQRAQSWCQKTHNMFIFYLELYIVSQIPSS